MPSEPAMRKKRGRPTDKRVADLKDKDKEEEVDARPFVDKAAPRVSDHGLLIMLSQPDLH